MHRHLLFLLLNFASLSSIYGFSCFSNKNICPEVYKGSLPSKLDFYSTLTVTKSKFNILENDNFLHFVCKNFKLEKSKLVEKFYLNRKCDGIQSKEYKTIFKSMFPDRFSCEDLANLGKIDDDKALIMQHCLRALDKEMYKNITQEQKKNFFDTLDRVLNGYKLILRDYPKLISLINTYSMNTSFDYRASQWVAGHRQGGWFQENEICENPSGEKDCKFSTDKHYIVPGGKIFLSKEELDIVIAHEVAHIFDTKDFSIIEIGRLFRKEPSVNDQLFSQVYSNDLELDFRQNIISVNSGSYDEGIQFLKSLQNEVVPDLFARFYLRSFYSDFDMIKKSTYFCSGFNSHLSIQKFYAESERRYLHPSHRLQLFMCSK